MVKDTQDSQSSEAKYCAKPGKAVPSSADEVGKQTCNQDEMSGDGVQM